MRTYMHHILCVPHEITTVTLRTWRGCESFISKSRAGVFLLSVPLMTCDIGQICIRTNATLSGENLLEMNHTETLLPD